MSDILSQPDLSFQEIFDAIINEGMSYYKQLTFPLSFNFGNADMQISASNNTNKVYSPDKTYTGEYTMPLITLNGSTITDYITASDQDINRIPNVNTNLKNSISPDHKIGSMVAPPTYGVAVLDEIHLEVDAPDDWIAGNGVVTFRVTSSDPVPNGKLYLCKLDYTSYPPTDNTVFFHSCREITANGNAQTVTFNVMPGFYRFAYIWHVKNNQEYQGVNTLTPRKKIEILDNISWSTYALSTRTIHTPDYNTSQYKYTDDKGVTYISEQGIGKFFHDAFEVIRNNPDFPTSSFSNPLPSHLTDYGRITNLKNYQGIPSDYTTKTNYQKFLDWLRSIFLFPKLGCPTDIHNDSTTCNADSTSAGHTTGSSNWITTSYVDLYKPEPFELLLVSGTDTFMFLNTLIRKNDNFLSDLVLTWDEAQGSGVESYDIEIMPDGAGTGYSVTSVITGTTISGEFEYTHVGDVSTASQIAYSGPGGFTEYYIGYSNTPPAWNGIQPCTWGTGAKPTTEHYIFKTARNTTYSESTKILDWIQNKGFRRFKITLQDNQIIQFTVNTITESQFADGYNTQANSPNYPTNPYYPDGTLVRLTVTYDQGKGFDDIIGAWNTNLGRSDTYIGSWQIPTTGIYPDRGFQVEPIEITYPNFGQGSLYNNYNWQVKRTDTNAMLNVGSGNFIILDGGAKFKLELSTELGSIPVEVKSEVIHGAFSIGNEQTNPSYYSSTNPTGSTYRVQDIKTTGVTLQIPNDWHPLVQTQAGGVFFNADFPKNFYYSIIAKMAEQNNGYAEGNASRLVRGGYVNRKQQKKLLSIDKNFPHINRTTELYPEQISYAAINGQGYRIHSFNKTYTDNNTHTITVTENMVVDLLLVGGGGAGGSSTAAHLTHVRFGGGGGGGDVKFLQNISLIPGTYTVTIGSGGTYAGTGTGNGGDSSFVGGNINYVAKGGGRGGGGDPALGTSSSAQGYTPGDGGSGGGGQSMITQTTTGQILSTLTAGSPGTATDSDGYDGGTGTAYGAGGGGGAGGEGGGGPTYDSNNKFFVDQVNDTVSFGGSNWPYLYGSAWYSGPEGKNGPSKGGDGVMIDFDGSGEKEYGAGGQGGGGLAGMPYNLSVGSHNQGQTRMPLDGPFLHAGLDWSLVELRAQATGVAWDAGHRPSGVPGNPYENVSGQRFSDAGGAVAAGGVTLFGLSLGGLALGTDTRGNGGGGASGFMDYGRAGYTSAAQGQGMPGGRGFVGIRYKWATNNGIPYVEYEPQSYVTYTSSPGGSTTFATGQTTYLDENDPNSDKSNQTQLFLNAEMGQRRHIYLKFRMPSVNNGTIIGIRLLMKCTDITSWGTTHPTGELREITQASFITGVFAPTWNNIKGTTAWTTPGGMAPGSANSTVIDRVDFSTVTIGQSVAWTIMGAGAENSTFWAPGSDHYIIIYDSRTDLTSYQSSKRITFDSYSPVIGQEDWPKLEVTYQI